MIAIRRTVRLLLWLIPGLVIGIFVYILTDSAYELLHKWMPRAFPIYNALHDPLSYESFMIKKSGFSVLVTLFISVCLSLMYDNERDEYVISKTDGLYEIPEIKEIYFTAFALSDAVAALICGALITLPVLFVPVQLIETPGVLSALLTPLHTIHKSLGTEAFIITCTLSVLILHLPSLPIAAGYWRSKWLSA